jgi:hypothetical protein
LKKAVLIFLSIAFFYSCKKEGSVINTLPVDQAYFPLQSGYWIEYEADSVIHLDSDDRYLVDTSIVSYHFFIREQTDSSYTDAMGETAWVISRYRRSADSLPWSFMSLWTAKIRLSSAERVEENQRYVKLSFPFNSRAEWNGNAYNNYPEELYSYDDLFEPVSYDGLGFDSSVTVIQNDFISSINRIYKIEKYAPRVGMIYKQTDSLRTANTPSGTIILNGFQYSLTVKDYHQ